jgi:putative MATE family efflux protein
MFRDKEFIIPFIRIAAPIALQNLFVSSLGIVDVMMVGQLGEAAIASVSLANLIFFLLNFTLFGINSGAAIFTAQYWGARDVAGIRKVLGVCLALGLTACVLFSGMSLLFPRQVLGFYSADPVVIDLGSQYLQIVGISYLATTLTLCYISVLRSTGRVRLPVFFGITTLCLNTGLNYLLIFGNFGFPRLGVQGAAIATSIARILECLAILGYAYFSRSPAAASPREMLAIDAGFLRTYFSVTLPVIINEVLWSLGTSFYSAIYAHVGTEAVAAFNVAVTILNLSSVLFVGVSTACGILVGNAIGAGQSDRAYQYARRCLWIGGILSAIIGMIVFFGRDLALSVYQLTPSGIQAARDVLGVLTIAVVYRAFNPTIIVGILRSGGDTRFSAILDVAAVWLVALPLAYLGAFVLQLPIALVVLCVLSEGLFKMVIGLHRFHSKKWINNLVQSS